VLACPCFHARACACALAQTRPEQPMETHTTLRRLIAQWNGMMEDLRDGILQLLGCLANFIELLDLEDAVAGGALTENEGGGLRERGGRWRECWFFQVLAAAPTHHVCSSSVVC